MTDLLSRLEQLKEQGILIDIDLQLYHFFKNLSEKPDEVLLSVVLLSYLYRQGDVCLKVDEMAGTALFTEAEYSGKLIAPALERWLKALKESDLVDSPGSYKPLILDQSNRLYLHKMWHFENNLAGNIIQKSNWNDEKTGPASFTGNLKKLFSDSEVAGIDWQKVASIAALFNRFTVISGGPGTGKTSTVIRILALLVQQAQQQDKKISIALSAPTGKAAARLKQSVRTAKKGLSVSDRVREAIPDKAMTIHQLLGARRQSARFIYNRENPLPHDVIIVDEASMVDQALMSKLMEALLEKTRVILLGDKDQLSSVEAGSVLGNICGIGKNAVSRKFADTLSRFDIDIPVENQTSSTAPLTDNIILLEKNYRFTDESGIARLATHINKQEHGKALAVLDNTENAEVSLHSVTELKILEQQLLELTGDYLGSVKNLGDPDQLFSKFQQNQILCAHRQGPFGVEYLNARMEQLLKRKGIVPPDLDWYHGRPVIINRNSYGLGLFNGDIGICIRDENGNRRIAFQREKEIQTFDPARLPGFSLAYALTIHKSQGSEFDRIILVLPDQTSRLVTKELLYTAVTRARTGVEIWGSREIFSEGIRRNISRSSGLKDRLWPNGSD